MTRPRTRFISDPQIKALIYEVWDRLPVEAQAKIGKAEVWTRDQLPLGRSGQVEWDAPEEQYLVSLCFERYESTAVKRYIIAHEFAHAYRGDTDLGAAVDRAPVPTKSKEEADLYVELKTDEQVRLWGFGADLTACWEQKQMPRPKPGAVDWYVRLNRLQKSMPATLFALLNTKAGMGLQTPSAGIWRTKAAGQRDKSFTVKILSKKAGGDGGQIMITTGGLDRDKDRVMPMGGKLENYKLNPVVCYAHSYSEPYQLIGRARKLDVTSAGIKADFDLRKPASPNDPQHIVRQLWNEGWINTASIGFIPLEWTDNEFGGRDYTSWEMLEFSLVPIPAQPAAGRIN